MCFHELFFRREIIETDKMIIAAENCFEKLLLKMFSNCQIINLNCTNCKELCGSNNDAFLPGFEISQTRLRSTLSNL